MIKLVQVVYQYVVLNWVQVCCTHPKKWSQNISIPPWWLAALYRS